MRFDQILRRSHRRRKMLAVGAYAQAVERLGDRRRLLGAQPLRKHICIRQWGM